MMIEMRARCPQCQTVRLLWGPLTVNSIDDMRAMETLVDIKGTARAVCPTCDMVEDVALFEDDKQTEPWENADEAERKNGPNAGPLPPIQGLD